MTVLDDLRKSAAEMSTEELIALTHDIRRHRREVAQERRKKAAEKTGRKVQQQLKIDDMPPEMLRAILAALEGAK